MARVNTPKSFHHIVSLFISTKQSCVAVYLLLPHSYSRDRNENITYVFLSFLMSCPIKYTPRHTHLPSRIFISQIVSACMDFCVRELKHVRNWIIYQQPRFIEFSTPRPKNHNFPKMHKIFLWLFINKTKIDKLRFIASFICSSFRWLSCDNRLLGLSSPSFLSMGDFRHE